jgi:F-type H+-transporting ATPase subunit delta
MKNTGVAKKLAKALMDVGIPGGEAERFGGDLKNIAAVFRANTQLAGTLLNPMYGLEERIDLMNKVSAALEVSPAVEKFMAILIETRNIRLLEEIERAYARLGDELAGRLRATIEAPEELSTAVLSDIQSRLSEITGKDVVLGSATDPSLIGGLVIKMGNTVIDGSIRTQLEQLKTRMIGA